MFVASVLHTRYGGGADDPVREPTRALLDAQAVGQVRTLGLALRLAYALTGGRIDLLAQTWLGRDRGTLVLDVPATDGLFAGETVQRRLDALARSIGAAAMVRRREPRRLAGD